MRSGLRNRLEKEPGILVVGETANGDGTMKACERLQPDVLVLDLNMPGSSATTIVAHAHETCPATKILVLTAYDNDAYVRGLVNAGVSGYVLKDEVPDALVIAVKSVANGATWFSRAIVSKLIHPAEQTTAGPHLTPRERELLELLGRGWDNWRLAHELHLSEQTVRNYLSRLYSKLGVQTRAGAIVWARDHESFSRPESSLIGD
jgi:DNA-binding NarL/FixJ family response regulator